jgi:tetratricopeptide (TPR) repeat protein
MGERTWLCSIAGMLAEALYRQGKLDEAETWVERARGWAPDTDLEAQADWRCIKGKLLARRGEADEGERLVREGLAIAQRTDEVDHIADAWADLAEVLRLADRADETPEAAHTAVEWYERKGNIAEAANVRRAFSF